MKPFTDLRFMNRNNRKNPLSFSLIKRLNEHPLKEKIKSKIKSFNKTQEQDYFKTDANIILNHRPHGPKYDKNNIIIPYTFVGPSNLFNDVRPKKNYSKKESSSSSLLSSSHYLRSISKKSVKREEKNVKKQQSNFLNNNALINIYKEIENRIKKNRLNKTVDDKSSFSSVPKFIQKNISNQEKILTRHLLFNKERERFLKKLLKKTGKIKKQDLLINNSNDYIIKNQTNLYKDKMESSDIKYKSNLWNITLRNPDKDGEFEYLGYQNFGNMTDPRFTLFNMSKNSEYSVLPGYSCKNNKSKKFKILFNTTNLEIKGKNLLDFEAKKELGFKGKKIYYKPNELDFLKYKEKNKLSILTEEDKFVNFGDKVYAENFNEKDYCEDQPLNIKYIKSNVSSFMK